LPYLILLLAAFYGRFGPEEWRSRHGGHPPAGGVRCAGVRGEGSIGVSVPAPVGELVASRAVAAADCRLDGTKKIIYGMIYGTPSR
jgi:hypothetical protein